MAAPDVPVGGSTGLDHESSAAIDVAAAWLAGLLPHEIPKPLVPALRRRFDLTAGDACTAIAEANKIRWRAP